MGRWLAIILLLLVGLISNAQSFEEEHRQIDSVLAKVEESSKSEGEILSNLYEAIKTIAAIETDLRLSLAKQLENKSKEYNNDEFLFKSYWLQASGYNKKADYSNTIKVMLECKSMLYIQENSNYMASVSSILGRAYMNNGNYDKAVEELYASAKYYDKSKDSVGLYYPYVNLGHLFYEQNEYQEALVNYQKAFDIAVNTREEKQLTLDYCNLGIALKGLGEVNKALHHLYRSLEIADSFQVHGHISRTGNRIALIYIEYADSLFKANRIDDANYWLDSAMVLCDNGLNSSRKMDNIRGVANSLTNISRIQSRKGNYIKSISNAKMALQELSKTNSPTEIRDAYDILFKSYRNSSNYKLALLYYEKYIQTQDSIVNKKNQKAAIRQQTKYEFEKAQLVKEQEEKEQARVEAEKVDRRNSLQYSIIFVAILAVFGLVLALGKVQVSPKVAEGLIFFAFLILFEFLLVLSDPYVDSMTNGEPMYKLLANALLAGLIFPLHAFFERTLKVRLIKNKKD